ncbi:uncharacterized protein LOC129351988 [Poeciliopsis prolifica]|uniref:uncharacterized protein LOC129351988 n=1 Tax=Poeciliopsis prolifica TaxID=188132 RepID=UPI00241434BE|nr:uncharacterized protein LOC129351988 [Poeciliopsis prolifica]
MSSEKNPEVVGCDASIMRNVWEIRMREFGQRMLLEQERLERSALPAINKDWADRMTAKMGKYKRVERKVAPSDIQPDDNIWKSKQPLVPQGVPLGRGLGPVGRPAVPARSFSAQAPNLKDKKVQDKSFNKLQLLMSITKTQPSSLVWGKAWKFNKSLPSPAEGASPDWGQSWMFAPYQPRAEEGKPWPNEPKLVDPQSYHLWRKAFYKMVEPQELDLNLPADEWQTSWKRFEKIKKDSAEDEEKAYKHGFFTSLVETQHQNESCVHQSGVIPGRPPSQAAKVYCKQRNSFKLPRHQKPLSPEWASSWRTAAGVFNKQSSSQNQHHGFDDHSLERDGFYKITSATRKRDLQFCNKFEAMGDWSKSWEIPKNNSKPCAEIDKVLKASPPKIDVETQKVEKIPQKPNNQLNTKGRSKELSDQRVILPTKIKMKKQLVSGMEKEKQSERKWAGCHLLGKTQPRPKKGSGSNRKLPPDDSVYKKFLEEWGESWRFFVRPENLKKQMSFKPISGWDESWKFLLPLY